MVVIGRMNYLVIFLCFSFVFPFKTRLKSVFYGYFKNYSSKKNHYEIFPRYFFEPIKRIPNIKHATKQSHETAGIHSFTLFMTLNRLVTHS